MRERLRAVINKLEDAGWERGGELLLVLVYIAEVCPENEVAEVLEAFRHA